MLKYYTLCGKAQTFIGEIKENTLMKKKKGDIAFEYVIILAIMAGVIFTGWNLLGNMVLQKINEIADALNNTHAY